LREFKLPPSLLYECLKRIYWFFHTYTFSGTNIVNFI